MNEKLLKQGRQQQLLDLLDSHSQEEFKKIQIGLRNLFIEIGDLKEARILNMLINDMRTLTRD